MADYPWWLHSIYIAPRNLLHLQWIPPQARQLREKLCWRALRNDLDSLGLVFSPFSSCCLLSIPQNTFAEEICRQQAYLIDWERERDILWSDESKHELNFCACTHTVDLPCRNKSIDVFTFKWTISVFVSSFGLHQTPQVSRYICFCSGRSLSLFANKYLLVITWGC